MRSGSWWGSCVGRGRQGQLLLAAPRWYVAPLAVGFVGSILARAVARGPQMPDAIGLLVGGAVFYLVAHANVSTGEKLLAYADEVER